MTTLPRHRSIRWLASVQALLVLCMSMGSICMREGEAASLEFGVCGCAIPVDACPQAPVIAGSAGPECGPCRDEAILALPGTRTSLAASWLATPVAMHSLAVPALVPCPGAGACPAFGTHPPRSSRTILRC